MTKQVFSEPKKDREMTGHDLITTVHYYNDPGDGSAPTPVYVGSSQVTNERPMVPTTVTVTDVTGDERSFTLDTHGFQFHSHTSKEKDFHEKEVPANYYPECEQLLKDMQHNAGVDRRGRPRTLTSPLTLRDFSNSTGASRVIAFDYKVRRGPSFWHKLGEHNTKSRGPLHRAHVDQSYDGAVIRLREALPDEADELLLSRRWQIINIWRPLKTVYKDPLAFADARSVDDKDLVAASIIFTKTGRRLESWTVKPNPLHRWHYKHAQQPDEVVLIKCFDSDASVARRVPHCAVEDPDERGMECRESVEVRLFVFY
ncbi:hypothetical protein B0T19DRAFT_436643 [Cercophora scortea]|uniref:Uncharacterized protein n=1 Tax=Cercophora scortea TaxID=314031 RepID=A0AAE0MKH8_9PEZI|nr:hypothetical protein B0T19DRAFT_436643 [Cercophora scortea]